MDKIIGGLTAGLGILAALVALAILWEYVRRAWYWTAAKVMGWDDREKFKRETRWLERAEQRATRQREKDEAVAGDHNRKRGGAALLTGLLIGLLATYVAMPWWQIALCALVAYIGLHMVAGVTIKWWE